MERVAPSATPKALFHASSHPGTGPLAPRNNAQSLAAPAARRMLCASRAQRPFDAVVRFARHVSLARTSISTDAGGAFCPRPRMGE